MNSVTINCRTEEDARRFMELTVKLRKEAMITNRERLDLFGVMDRAIGLKLSQEEPKF